MKQKTKIKFCKRCGMIKIIGCWQRITDEISRILNAKPNEWEKELTVCDDCAR